MLRGKDTVMVEFAGILFVGMIRMVIVLRALFTSPGEKVRLQFEKNPSLRRRYLG